MRYLGVQEPTDCSYQLRNPYPHCLQRDFTRLAFSSSYTPQGLNRVIFDEHSAYFHFNDLMRQAPNVPNAINIPGPTGFSDTASPNDPIFFLHIAQVDRIWALWQQARRQYGKSPKEFNGFWKQRLVTLRDELEPFGICAEQVMDPTEELCYVYALSGTRLW
jgi:hypothetical protein